MPNSLRRASAALIPLFLLSFAAAPEETKLSLNVLGVWYPPNHAGYGESGYAAPDFSVVGGGPGQRDLGIGQGGKKEIKASFGAVRSIPFVLGSGPLFASNTADLAAEADLSPVSTALTLKASAQPLAFLVFEAGAMVGTGWQLWSFYGIAVNPTQASGEDPSEASGAVYRAWGSGTLQFDWAAIRPGAWNHVVARATGRLEYRAFTGASDGEAWYWEAGEGENFNGWKFIGTYFAGYRMPAFCSLAGVMAESEEWLGTVRSSSPMSEAGGWGSDFRAWRVGPVAALDLGRADELALIGQFRCRQDWSDGTTRNRDFRSRDYEGSVWWFDRIVLSYTHKFLPSKGSRH